MLKNTGSIFIFVFFMLTIGVFGAQWENAYFRGTTNAWATTAMTVNSEGLWELELTTGTGDGGGGPRFKIDRYGDWTENYPTVDFTLGTNKTYTITFNDSTKEIKAIGAPGAEWYFRGTANAWALNLLTYNSTTGLYEIESSFAAGDTNPRFKIDRYGDWTENYPSGSDFAVTAGITYLITFNASTKEIIAEPAAQEIPLAPTGLSLSNITTSTMNLSWTASTGASLYEVFRSTIVDGTYESIGTTTAVSYVSSELEMDTLYYYKVKASNSVGVSDFSLVVSGTTDLITTPSIPTGLSAGNPTTTTIDLNWTIVSNAASYEIYTALGASVPYELLTTTTSTSYTVTGLEPETTHYYKIKAVNSAGASSYSDDVFSTTSKETVEPWYFRGTSNLWVATEMNYNSTTGLYYINQSFVAGDGGGGPRFKIDHYGDWTENYPGTDYTVETNTTYYITFNATTKEVVATIPYVEPWYLVVGNVRELMTQDGSNWNYTNYLASETSITVENESATESYTASVEIGKTYNISIGSETKILAVIEVIEGAWYLRGSVNKWGATPMVKNTETGLFELEVKFNLGDEGGRPRFKIDHYGDWTEYYPTEDFTVAPYTDGIVRFNETTHEISLEITHNSTLMQYWEWYMHNDETEYGIFDLWTQLEADAKELADYGIDGLWLPPAHKTRGADWWDAVGYSVYDYFDLGEFSQPAGEKIRTKYGTREQLDAAIKASHDNGIEIYFDIVFNHMTGGEAEIIPGASVYDKASGDYEGHRDEIVSYTKYDFAERAGAYSDFTWNYNHFDGCDYDANYGYEAKLFLFDGHAWDQTIKKDYMLQTDIDFENPEVRAELIKIGKWLVNDVGVDGFRLDAVMHIEPEFWIEWLNALEESSGKHHFTIGEYWEYDHVELNEYIEQTGNMQTVFDVALHYEMEKASVEGGDYDMSTMLDNTMMTHNPDKAITFVDSHDTQYGQRLESWVNDWFRPQSNAIILLRAEGIPLLFYTDYYGGYYNTNGPDGDGDWITLNKVDELPKLMEARQKFAYGEQYSNFTDSDVVGWSRKGDQYHDKAMAVVITDGNSGTVSLDIGKANVRFYDYLGKRSDIITTDGTGWGNFPVNEKSVSVWVQE